MMTAENPNIDRSTLREMASKGRTLAMCASHWDLYEKELQAYLKKDKALQRAYDMGYANYRANIFDKLNESSDRGLLLLMARMHLELDDPIIDKLSGGLLQEALKKTPKETKQTLASILGIK